MAIGSVEIHDERRLDGTNLIERFVCPFPDKSCANLNTAIHDKCTKIILYLRGDLVLDRHAHRCPIFRRSTACSEAKYLTPADTHIEEHCHCPTASRSRL